MAGSDLHTAMAILSSVTLAKQGRLLRVEPLLSDLRTAVSGVIAMEDTPAGMIELTYDKRVRYASARLRQVLQEVLDKNPLFGHGFDGELRRLILELRGIISPPSRLAYNLGIRCLPQGNLVNLGNSSVVDANQLGNLQVVDEMVRILIRDRTGGARGPLFLPLAGEPGSGKTLLARTLFHDARVVEKCDLRAWVDVSQPFDVSVIMRKILVALEVSTVDQAVLKSHVWRDKRFLMVLDDVCSQNVQECRHLMQSLPPIATLILTTRIPAAVASCMATVEPDRSNPVDKELHSKFVLLWRNEHDSFVMRSGHPSYLRLPFNMRKCLLFCSVFPLSYEFDPEELADLLNAQGHIPPTDRDSQATRTRYVQKLFDECFHPVEESESATGKRAYRMQNILHRFAQIVDRRGETLQNSGTGIWEEFSFQHLPVHYLSVHSIDDRLLGFKKLRTLILLPKFLPRRDHNLEKAEIDELPQWFGQSFRHLIALDLRDSYISTLPRNFDMMCYLKYLNLSRTDIENIPSFVSKLQILQTLILSHCEKLLKLHGTISKHVHLEKLDLQGCLYLAELPPNMNKMKSLQHLNVHECSSLTRMPYNMGQLTNLQTMLGYVVSNNDGRAISELQSLTNLKKLSLEGLENISDVSFARSARLLEKLELESLVLQWNKGADNTTTSTVSEVLELLRPNEQLKTLDIVAYEGNALPSWMTSSVIYLVSLVEIRLLNIKVCETLPPLGLLPLLKIVEISAAEAISSLNSIYGADGTFPSLEKLIFSYMCNLELWEKPHSGPAFPCLAEVTIIQCPKLAIHVELPSVTKLILCMNNKMLHGSKGSLGNMAHSLKYVSISFCQELGASSYCEGLQDLCRLEGLELSGCDEMTCLPDSLQHLSSLRRLTIVHCNKLETIPDWLENLPSLLLVRLSSCPMLHSFPEGLRQRRCTEIIIEACPNLSLQPLAVKSDNIGKEESTACEIICGNSHESKSANMVASNSVQPELFDIVMNILGFTEEQLICVYSHLIDNEAQEKAFVDMSEVRRISWIRKFLGKRVSLADE
ncbi:hypothetical protein ACQJBY_056756 [Aegilops geniculata]